MPSLVCPPFPVMKFKRKHKKKQVEIELFVASVRCASSSTGRQGSQSTRKFVCAYFYFVCIFLFSIINQSNFVFVSVCVVSSALLARFPRFPPPLQQQQQTKKLFLHPSTGCSWMNTSRMTSSSRWLRVFLMHLRQNRISICHPNHVLPVAVLKVLPKRTESTEEEGANRRLHPVVDWSRVAAIPASQLKMIWASLEWAAPVSFWNRWVQTNSSLQLILIL